MLRIIVYVCKPTAQFNILLFLKIFTYQRRIQKMRMDGYSQ